MKLKTNKKEAKYFKSQKDGKILEIQFISIFFIENITSRKYTLLNPKSDQDFIYKHIVL